MAEQEPKNFITLNVNTLPRLLLILQASKPEPYAEWGLSVVSEQLKVFEQHILSLQDKAKTNTNALLGFESLLTNIFEDSGILIERFDRANPAYVNTVCKIFLKCTKVDPRTIKYGNIFYSTWDSPILNPREVDLLIRSYNLNGESKGGRAIIAESLGVSMPTIRDHLNKAEGKLGQQIDIHR